MDARITKQRLGNLLSYDWLKILGVIVAAVLVLTVIFTMIATRPTVAQVYTVFTYGGLNIGNDSASLTDALRGSFSYDILEVEMENFEDSSMAEQALTARRGILEGDVIVAADYAEGDADTPFERAVRGYSSVNTQNVLRGFHEIPAFLDETKAYLATFFDDPLTEEDETLTREEPIKGQVEAAFTRRNGSDKRFKTQAQKDAGIAEEGARILSIRKNYLAVTAALERGELYTVDYVYSPEDGEEELHFPIGVGLGKLTGLGELFYYYEGSSVSTKDIALLFFYNGDSGEESKYENLAFLNYLLEHYAPAHS